MWRLLAVLVLAGCGGTAEGVPFEAYDVPGISDADLLDACDGVTGASCGLMLPALETDAKRRGCDEADVLAWLRFLGGDEPTYPACFE